MVYTRKNRKGGGIFNTLTGKSANTTAKESSLKAKRNYNLRHSKSRVANVLSVPGQVRHTNKERIEADYQKAVEKLRSIEKPAETAQAARGLVDKLKAALQSDEARMAGAVTITLPVGVAQLLIKGLLVFISALVFVFWDLPTLSSIPLSPFIFPNSKFNTTQSVFEEAKGFTGVGSKEVKEW
jgi:hypothetical protein